jgi:hypothetical protein
MVAESDSRTTGAMVGWVKYGIPKGKSWMSTVGLLLKLDVSSGHGKTK